MNDALDFFRKLLDTSDWPPRWHCGKWTEFHGWFYIISDLLIWSAYFAIPLIILKFISRRSKARFVRAYFLFAAFILACGSTHLLDAVTFWFPAYRLNALVRFITGVVSWTTVFYMIKIMPEAMTLKTTEELEKEVSERKKAEQELRIANQQLNVAQSIANLGHWQWDVVNNKLFWSEKLYEIYSVDTKESLTYDRYLQLIHPDDRERVAGLVQNALQSRQLPAFYHRLAGTSNNDKIILGKGEVITDEHGRIISMIGTAQDVTEQQKAQLALIEKTRALQETNSELQRFAYVASHDLQEPLRKTLTFASLLEKHIAGSADEKTRMYVQKIVQSTSRMQHLIEDILQFSSVKEKRQGYEPVDLHQVLQQVLSDMEVMIEEKAAKVDWSSLPQIEAISTQMYQLLQNLLSNAMKFSKPGEPPQIQIRYRLLAGSKLRSLDDLSDYLQQLPASEQQRSDAEFMLLTIEDNGIGFDPRYERKVFEIFQRLHPGHEYGGTGIGLAICKRIVENHNGFIAVRSAEGKGTTFSVVLPVSQQPFNQGFSMADAS